MAHELVGKNIRSASQLTVGLKAIAEKDKFVLAKWLLLGVAVLFIFGTLSFLIFPEHGKEVFEACKSILPPLATLVIGYYFSERAKGK